MGLSVLTHIYGVRRGLVDKAPSCCNVAQGSILGPAPPNGVIQFNAVEQTHRTPHQNSRMISTTDKKFKEEFGRWVAKLVAR